MDIVFNLCRYFGKCGLSQKTSFTCTHGGGNYCGRFRDLESELKDNEIPVPMEV